MASDHSRSDKLLEAIKQGKFPRHVYKFRAEGEYTDRIFSDLSLWFGSPSFFNDPFDCNLSEVKEHSLADVQKLYASLTAAQPRLPQTPPSVSDLEKKVELAKKKALDKTGVFCVSKRCDNILMWSHYAKDHTGLAVEFDMAEDLETFTTPINVKYVNSYTPTNYFANPQATVTKIIRTKSNSWAYENEIRIMKSGFTGGVTIKASAIKSVYFGCRAKDDFIAHIKGLCSTPSLKHLKFFKMYMSYGRFALQSQPI